MVDPTLTSGSEGSASAKREAMARSSPQLADFLDALDDPALLIDGGMVALANAAAKSLLGDLIEGSDVRLAIRHPQALELVLQRNPVDVEITGIGGVERPWRLSLRPVGNGAQLLRLIDRSAAHAAEKMRVDFVANASHELRTPLTTVLGYAESLEEGDLDPELAQKFAAMIRTEAKRMLRIIEDLMSLSRIEADRFVAPTQRLSVAAVVKSALENIRPAIEKCGCTVDATFGEDLPEVAGDFPQLVQVVDNLLSNALRYGCDPKGDIRVAVTAERGSVRIDVADNGPGIPREHLPRVTQRFYRVDEARSRDSGGTGLGLAIVKHIVERHRGTLSIDSAPGEGTRVTVRLPFGG